MDLLCSGYAARCDVLYVALQTHAIALELKTTVSELTRQSEELHLLRQELAKAKSGSKPASSPKARASASGKMSAQVSLSLWSASVSHAIADSIDHSQLILKAPSHLTVSSDLGPYNRFTHGLGLRPDNPGSLGLIGVWV